MVLSSEKTSFYVTLSGRSIFSNRHQIRVLSLNFTPTSFSAKSYTLSWLKLNREFKRQRLHNFDFVYSIRRRTVKNTAASCWHSGSGWDKLLGLFGPFSFYIWILSEQIFFSSSSSGYNICYLIIGASASLCWWELFKRIELFVFSIDFWRSMFNLADDVIPFELHNVFFSSNLCDWRDRLGVWMKTLFKLTLSLYCMSI